MSSFEIVDGIYLEYQFKKDKPEKGVSDQTLYICAYENDHLSMVLSTMYQNGDSSCPRIKMNRGELNSFIEKLLKIRLKIEHEKNRKGVGMSEWKDSMTVDEKLESDPKWYYVPPYNKEGHKILDSAGQEVATFEMKDQAIKAIKSYNNAIMKGVEIDKMGEHYGE